MCVLCICIYVCVCLCVAALPLRNQPPLRPRDLPTPGNPNLHTHVLTYVHTHIHTQPRRGLCCRAQHRHLRHAGRGPRPLLPPEREGASVLSETHTHIHSHIHTNLAGCLRVCPLLGGWVGDRTVPPSPLFPLAHMFSRTAALDHGLSHTHTRARVYTHTYTHIFTHLHTHSHTCPQVKAVTMVGAVIAKDGTMTGGRLEGGALDKKGGGGTVGRYVNTYIHTQTYMCAYDGICLYVCVCVCVCRLG